MYYMHDSLLPENQEKLVIQVAPYGPEFLPGDCADIPVTMDEQVQKAVDCFNAGAHVLHIHVREDDGTSLATPQMQAAYKDMYLEAGPTFYETNLRMLRENGIQPLFMLGDVAQLETVEHIIRKGMYMGPLNLNYVAIGGGQAGRHPSDLVEFAVRTPDGAVLTNESIMRTVHPTNAIAIALGHHVRVGVEDNLWSPRVEPMTSVQQIEWCVDIAGKLGRDVATADEARAIYKIGVSYDSVEETLRELGMPPNRQPGQRGRPIRK